MLELDKNCTIYIRSDKVEPFVASDVQKRLENASDEIKVKALEQLIIAMNQGEPCSRLLMSVIRFIIPSNHHRLKKLCQLYFEIVEKCTPDGSLKDEMILVCNALRNDLMSPNEYIRGSTLRLLCKMRYQKILEPLLDPIMKNLSHRHSYVRRHAVMCVYSIVKSFGLDVIPHAAEEVEKLLLVETDTSTKRNAFLMLLHCDDERALKYILSVQDVVTSLGDIFQLVLLELLRKVCRKNPTQKASSIRIIITIVRAASPAVCYEGAGSLICLSTARMAIDAACMAYCKVLCSSSDINVKLIVLDRLASVVEKHHYILDLYVMEILRALVCPSIVVRKKCLDIAVLLVSSRNVHDVLAVLKKEVVKSMDSEQQATPNNLEYRKLLIRAIHTACTKYPEIAQSVVHLLMDFLGETDVAAATEVAMFLREIVSIYPGMRALMLKRICETLPEIQQSRVLRVCLWVVGEFSEEDTSTSLAAIFDSIKPLPLTKSQIGGPGATDSGKTCSENLPAVKVTTRTVVLEDGTYGTEDVIDQSDPVPLNKTTEPACSYLRQLIVGGDTLLANVLAITITKLALREFVENSTFKLSNKLKNRTLLVVASIFNFLKSDQTTSTFRVSQCLKALLAVYRGSTSKEEVQKQTNAFLGFTRDSLESVLRIEKYTSGIGNATTEDTSDENQATEPDEGIVFRQLCGKRNTSDVLAGADEDVQNALGEISGEKDESTLFQLRLAKVQQLTGLADPVYVEAFLQVHQFDSVIELYVINRTNETLQNISIDLSTHGDLKIVDKPSPITLAAHQAATLNATVKVQSTETGIIFGYVSFDTSSATEKRSLVLHELHIDLLDYIQKSYIGEMAFRTMWSDFEWENKININTSLSDVGSFLKNLMDNTNMTIVGKYGTGKSSDAGKNISPGDEKKLCTHAIDKLSNNSSFFATNLYSRSIFGEDALANISVEKLPDGKLAGSFRIRSRTQGIALSLGDRITVIQRNMVTNV